jgi:hypothetical protein
MSAKDKLVMEEKKRGRARKVGRGGGVFGFGWIFFLRHNACDWKDKAGIIQKAATAQTNADQKKPRADTLEAIKSNSPIVICGGLRQRSFCQVDW